MVTPEDSERKKVQSAWEILSELTFKVVVLRHKIDLMVPTLDGRVQNLLQEAQIRVEESHPDKLEKENSIEDLKKRERLLRESLDTLYEVKRELEDQLCQMLLKELYQALIAPVEAALEGAEELLIVPHKTLFEVPWAALTDADGSYLVEWYVIRTVPSLRVARQAADKMQQQGNQPRGHVVLVGNPLPIPTRFTSLPDAEKEARHINEILEGAQVVLHSKHIYFGPNPSRSPTKTHVKESLEGADWAHLACHADSETDALILADASDGADQDSNLTMHEVQGSERAQGVRLAQGATVVLSACNTARGEIKAEGVVGLSRGFLLANASATVVSLWSVDDGSTAALMRIKYSHLAQGCTVPKALRLAMLRLARRPPHKLGQKQTRDRAAGARVSDDSESSEASQDEHCDELEEAWKQPIHWAAFLVVGATTSLRHHSPNQPA
jgi:CHAT domain-containing protein